MLSTNSFARMGPGAGSKEMCFMRIIGDGTFSDVSGVMGLDFVEDGRHSPWPISMAMAGWKCFSRIAMVRSCGC